jgi:hypothetical protein
MIFYISFLRLFDDPRNGGLSPFDETFGEPEGDFLGGGFFTVRSVADVAADVEGEVTTDGAGGGGSGVGFTEEGAALLDDVDAFPDHTDDGAGGEEFAESGEEGLGGEVTVVLLGLFGGGLEHLEGDELETLLFEALDDFTNETTLDTIGLNSDEGTLSGHYL